MEISREQILSRIDERLVELKVSPNEASARAGLERTFLSQLNRSDTRWPRVDNLQRICDAIGLRMYWVATGLGPRLIEEADFTADVASVPVVSWVAASRLAETSSIDARADLPRILVPNLGRGDFMALKVVGDSMNIIAPEGAHIVVNRAEKELIPRAFYVFSSVDGEEATFKRWMTRPDRLEPYSTNMEHEAIYPEKAPVVVGRVRKVMLDL